MTRAQDWFDVFTEDQAPDAPNVIHLPFMQDGPDMLVLDGDATDEELGRVWAGRATHTNPPGWYPHGDKEEWQYWTGYHWQTCSEICEHTGERQKPIRHRAPTRMGRAWSWLRRALQGNALAYVALAANAGVGAYLIWRAVP